MSQMYKNSPNLADVSADLVSSQHLPGTESGKSSLGVKRFKSRTDKKIELRTEVENDYYGRGFEESSEP